LARLDELRKDPKIQILELFSKVLNTGPSKALRYYQQGYRTLEQLA